MPLNLEESKYALSKILAVLMSPWQPGINYDNLKAAADRHQKRIDELEAAQHRVQRIGGTSAEIDYEQMDDISQMWSDEESANR